jgi:hypothetical protein
LYRQKECRLSTHDRTTYRLTTTHTNLHRRRNRQNQNAQEAFMSGKIQVSDLGKMMQFSTLFRKLNNETMK